MKWIEKGFRVTRSRQDIRIRSPKEIEKSGEKGIPASGTFSVFSGMRVEESRGGHCLIRESVRGQRYRMRGMNHSNKTSAQHIRVLE